MDILSGNQTAEINRRVAASRGIRINPEKLDGIRPFIGASFATKTPNKLWQAATVTVCFSMAAFWSGRYLLKKSRSTPQL